MTGQEASRLLKRKTQWLWILNSQIGNLSREQTKANF